MTDDKLNFYVEKLKNMVKSHDFSGHKILKHGADCPAESVDVFQLPESKRYSDLQASEQDYYNELGEQLTAEGEEDQEVPPEQMEEHETDEL